MKIKKVFQRIFPWLRDPPDPAAYRRAKAFMLGAGAGSAIKPDQDGKVRIEVDKDGDD